MSSLLMILAAVLSSAARPAQEPAGELVAAAARADTATLRALLRRGVPPDLRDAEGRPALLAAASAGGPDAVRALLQAGADPDAGDPSGWTALHAAAARGDLVLVDLLLQAGARPDLRSRAYGTALDLAERAQRAPLVRRLRAAGARGSGQSVGDVVCVRVWGGDGYCATVESRGATEVDLRVTRIVGCRHGCAPEAQCSAGRPVSGNGLQPGDGLRVPASCLTHTGVR